MANEIPFMLQQPATGSSIYTQNGDMGLGHPLSSARWFTGDTSVPGFVGPPSTAANLGSGIPFNAANGGFGAGANAPMAGPSWFEKIGGMEGIGQGVSAFANLANIYAGFKSLGLAKDQLQFSKSSFNKNFNAQAQSYNNELKDRWTARNASAQARGQSYESMDSWLSGRQINQTGKDKDRVNNGG
jgi:hypothetical protein